jgi:hypothetical protein
MLTLFSIPKAFQGHSDLIQRNAIHSWTLLRPSCEILLFGNDQGTAEVAAEYNLRHIPDIARSQYGTPLVNDIFEQAQRQASSNILCYVNADIILTNDFMEAIETMVSQKNRWLMVGQRWDISIDNLLDFDREWDKRLRTEVRTKGNLHKFDAIDYFAFTRDLYTNIPAFAIGRTAWDNWLIYRARAQKVVVVDATPGVMAIHQNHDYSHVKGGKEEIFHGREAALNRELAGNGHYIFDLYDATHILTPTGIRRLTSNRHLLQRLKRQAVIDDSKTKYLRQPLLKAITIIWRRLAYVLSK